MDKTSQYYTEQCIELKDLVVGQTYYVFNGDWKFKVLSKNDYSLDIWIIELQEKRLEIHFDSTLYVVLI